MNKNIILLLCTAMLAACGGGGGNGDSVSSGNGGANFTAITYTGNTSAATLTVESSNKFAEILLGDGDVIDTSAGVVGVQSINLSSTDTSPRINEVLQQISDVATNSIQSYRNESNGSYVVAIDVNETFNCQIQGYVTTTGNVDENLNGTLVSTFHDCTDLSGTLHGRMTTTRTYSPSEFRLSLSVDIQRLMMRAHDFHVEMSGQMSVIEIQGNHWSETLVSNLVLNNVSNGDQYKTENLQIIREREFYQTNITETISGRLYVADYGYIDLVTESPFIYAGGNEIDEGGARLNLIGALGSVARLVTTVAERVRVEVDSDGDSVFESSTVFNSDDVGGVTPQNLPPDMSDYLGPVFSYSDVNVSINDIFDYVFDPDADPMSVSVAWSRNGTLLSNESSMVLSSNNFVAGDQIEVTVSVSDGYNADVLESFQGEIRNRVPVADAGPDVEFEYTGGSVVFTLDGSASYDEDDGLTYQWSAPVYHELADDIEMQNATNSVVDVRITGLGSYEFELRVTDVAGASRSDRVLVDVVPMDLFHEPVRYSPVGAPTRSVAVGDVNNDGLKDIVIATEHESFNPLSNSIFVYLQSDAGSFGDPIRYDSGVSVDTYLDELESVAIGDVNGDGRSDVVYSHPDGIGLLLQNSEGTLASFEVIPGSGAGEYVPYQVRVGDVNNDQRDDVVAIYKGYFSKNVDIFLQNDIGSLEGPIIYTSLHDGGWDDSLVLDDANNDGLTDIVILSGRLNFESDVSILYQQSDNTMGDVVGYPAIQSTSIDAGDLAIGDVNSDGINEVLATLDSLPSKLLVYEQSHTGELAVPDDYQAVYSSQSSAGPIGVGDVNGDGRNDVIVMHRREGVGVHLQREDGTLMESQAFSVASGGGGFSTHDVDYLRVADMNGDGFDDVLVAVGMPIVLYSKNTP